MILLDYSQVAISSILAFGNELKKNDDKARVDLIRHVVLSSIRSYKQKYAKEYGELVIACDGRNYWRKEFFPLYKGQRKKAREESDLDWKLIFDTLSQLREDIKQYFPYKVIHLDRCEADDVIAVLCKWTQDNGMVQCGLFEEPQKVMIVSSDGDFLQLQEYENVKQYSPKVKKQVSLNKAELKKKIIEHIVKGDSGDCISNILSADDSVYTGTRQTPVSSKRLNEFIELGIDACKNDRERARFQQNQALVNFKFIPKDVEELIVNEYNTYTTKGNKNSIMSYLIKNKCRQLLDTLEEF